MLVQRMINTMWSSTKALTVGNAALFRLTFVDIFKPYFHLPKELYNDAALASRMGERKDFSLLVDRKFVDEYNAGMDNMGKDIKLLWGASDPVDFRLKQSLFWLVRFATIAAAFYPTDDQLARVFLISLLQFIVLPYSLSMSLCYGLETVFVLYTGHVVVMSILTALSGTLIPDEYNYTITISSTLLIAFLIVDQLLCTCTLFWTPMGPVEKLPASRIWQSVWYGFLNCKTYYLVLFPLVYGTKIALIPWMVDWMFGLSNLITTRTMVYWNVLFYHAHRIGHLPIVYSDAHRFHHYLHDATSFDAHIFGSGAPEEWLILATDIFMARFMGIFPAQLSPSVLAVSWYNKWGYHSRLESPADDGDNFHVNHHSRHVTNIGNAYPYDLLMGTAMKDKVKWAGYEIYREITEDAKSYKLCFDFLGDDGEVVTAPKRRSLTMSGIDFSGLGR